MSKDDLRILYPQGVNLYASVDTGRLRLLFARVDWDISVENGIPFEPIRVVFVKDAVDRNAVSELREVLLGHGSRAIPNVVGWVCVPVDLVRRMFPDA